MPQCHLASTPGVSFACQQQGIVRNSPSGHIQVYIEEECTQLYIHPISEVSKDLRHGCKYFQGQILVYSVFTWQDNCIRNLMVKRIGAGEKMHGTFQKYQRKGLVNFVAGRREGTCIFGNKCTFNTLYYMRAQNNYF